MKLYYAPGACSLAPHIALHEAGLDFDHVKVDLAAHTVEGGGDYFAVNPKGYVPALTLDGSETLTENVAILDWIAHQAPRLRPEGTLGHTHLLEMLAFISTELHKSFAPFFQKGSDEEKAKAAEKIGKRFNWISGEMAGDYLFGAEPSVADCYLFVMLTWAKKHGVDAPAALGAFAERMRGRESVRAALTHEGLG